MKNKKFFPLIAFCTLFLLVSHYAYSWDDWTHIEIAKAAGYCRWYNAAGADLAKIKAGTVESYNHYSNNPPGTIITKEYVLKQARFYNNDEHKEGHLYGAVIASVRQYMKMIKEDRPAEPFLDYTVHYIGDLSQPLHNTEYDEFNKKNHSKIDSIFNNDSACKCLEITPYNIEIKNEDDLASEVARIANISIKLGYNIEKENRILTIQEAHQQIRHSISLLKGLLEYLEKQTGRRLTVCKIIPGR